MLKSSFLSTAFLDSYYCRMMGAPIDRLVIASNQNDILPKFFEVTYGTGGSNGLVAALVLLSDGHVFLP